MHDDELGDRVILDDGDTWSSILGASVVINGVHFDLTGILAATTDATLMQNRIEPYPSGSNPSDAATATGMYDD